MNCGAVARKMLPDKNANRCAFTDDARINRWFKISGWVLPLSHIVSIETKCAFNHLAIPPTGAVDGHSTLRRATGASVSYFDAPEPIPAPRSVRAAHGTYILRVVHVSALTAQRHSGTQRHGGHQVLGHIVTRAHRRTGCRIQAP